MSDLPIDRGRAARGFVAVAARLIVAFFFVAAGVMKLQGLKAFAKEIYQYNMVPYEWTHLIAFFIPPFELVLAAALLFGIWRKEARGVLFVMLLFFTALKINAVAHGLKIECGCFGKGTFLTEVFSGVWGIVLNFGLLGCLIADYLLERRSNPRSKSEIAKATVAARTTEAPATVSHS